MKNLFFQAEVKSIERLDEGVKFRGLASTPHIDRTEDIVLPSAFEKSLNEYLKNPVLLRSHNADRPVGRILSDSEDSPVITEAGLIVSGIVTEKDTAEQILNGEMRAMSIGFIPKHIDFEMKKTGRYDREGRELELEVRVIKDLELVEISIVTTPANPKALFTVQKSLEEHFSLSPSPTMEHTCQYCEKHNASGRIGKKFICKSCISDVCVKSDDIETLSFDTEQDATEYAESRDDIESYSVEQQDEKFVLVEVKFSEETEEDVEEEEVVEEETEEDAEEIEEEEEEEEESTEEDSEAVETEDETTSAEDDSEEESQEDGEEKILLSKEDKDNVDYLAKLLSDLSQKTSVKEEVESIDMKSILAITVKLAEELKTTREHLEMAKSVIANTPLQKGKTITTMQFNDQNPSQAKKDESNKTYLKMFEEARSVRGF